MSLNSIYFIFVFLPISVLLYFITPKKLRTLLLVIISLVFYAWGDLTNVLYLGVSIIFNYITGIELEKLLDSKKKKEAFIVILTATSGNVILLGIMKYSDLVLPVGMSFYTFMVLSYIFDVYNKKAKAQHNFIKFMLYVSFFPKITMGPIVEYRDMQEQIDTYTFSKQKLLEGTSLFLVGLLKKVILADNLGAAFTSVYGNASTSVLGAWLGMIFYGLQLYFDFSGYSDMAIGISKMFGFEFDKNFDYPYTSKNITVFWRKWHISLGTWFKDYVYIPLGGNRVGKARLFANLLVVWVLTGVWHGSTWNFVIWGLYHGAFAMLERFVIKDRLESVPNMIRVLVTDLIVFVGWIFFFTPDIGDALSYMGNLIGIGTSGFSASGAFFYLRTHCILLVISIIGCVPIVKNVYTNVFFTSRSKISENTAYAINVLGTVILFAVAVAFMIGGTYSSFLYAKF